RGPIHNGLEQGNETVDATIIRNRGVNAYQRSASFSRPRNGRSTRSISAEWADSRNTERTTHGIPTESHRHVVGTASKRNRSVGFTGGKDNRFRRVVVV